MKKHPLYIGVFLTDPKNQTKQIRNYTRQSLAQLAELYPELAPIVENDLENNMIFPRDNHHITTAFLGKNCPPIAKKIFNNFVYEKKVAINIDLFVYVPGYLIVGFCGCRNLIEVENQYPHLTLYQSQQAQAKESNAILELIFKERPQILKQQEKSYILEQQYNNKKVYIIRNCIELDGITGDNWRNGRRK